MRELKKEELKVVSGGLLGSLSIAPLGSLPALSFTFSGTQGVLSFNGMSIPFGSGFPVIRLP